MESELYRVIKSISVDLLTVDDKVELLVLFRHTKNDLVRNRLALLFSDAEYKEAVPDIIEKINQEDMRNKNGTLVFALGNLVTGSNILVKIMCEQEYEARLMAFEIIDGLASSLDPNSRKQMLDVLEKYWNDLSVTQSPFEENGALHFIGETKKIIRDN